MVRRLIPITFHTVLKSFASNCAPLSVNIESGIPYGKIQLLMNATVASPAVFFAWGSRLSFFLWVRYD